MAITKDDVLLIAPELTNITSNQWDAILLDVSTQVDSAVWGTKAALASKYLAAHYATLANGSSSTPGGVTIGRKVGEVSENYANPLGRANNLWVLTKYGTIYANLLRQFAGRWLVT